MLAALIFVVHAVAAVYAFRKYRKESLGEGFLAVGFMCIIFAVGWTIATSLTNLLFTPEWFVKWYYQPVDSDFWNFVRKQVNRDVISLLILTVGESVFYYFAYFKGERRKGTPESAGQTPGANPPAPPSSGV